MLGELTTNQVSKQLQLPASWIRRNALRLGGRKRQGQWFFKQATIDRVGTKYAAVGDTFWYHTTIMRCPDCGAESNRERVKVDGLPPLATSERAEYVDTPCMFCT